MQRGQVFKKTKDNWAIRYYSGRRLASGRLERRQESGFKSREEAIAVLETRLAQVRLGHLYRPDLIVDELIDRYLAQHQADEATLTKLRWQLAHVRRGFGDARLRDLFPEEIGAWRIKLPEGSRRDIHQAFRQVLEAAVRWRFIAENPARLVPNPMFRVGDRVLCRRNDSHLHLRNGTLGTIVDLDRSTLTVRTDAGMTRSLPLPYVAEHLDHAYALTGHAAQGATVERTFVLLHGEGALREWGYVACSRARTETSTSPRLPASARRMDARPRSLLTPSVPPTRSRAPPLSRLRSNRPERRARPPHVFSFVNTSSSTGCAREQRSDSRPRSMSSSTSAGAPATDGSNSRRRSPFRKPRCISPTKNSPSSQPSGYPTHHACLARVGPPNALGYSRSQASARPRESRSTAETPRPANHNRGPPADSRSIQASCRAREMFAPTSSSSGGGTSSRAEWPARSESRSRAARRTSASTRRSHGSRFSVAAPAGESHALPLPPI